MLGCVLLRHHCMTVSRKPLLRNSTKILSLKESHAVTQARGPTYAPNKQVVTMMSVPGGVRFKHEDKRSDLVRHSALDSGWIKYKQRCRQN